MANMVLDLSVFQEETLDITLPDGNIVKVSKPTERLFIEFMKYENFKADKHKPEEIVEMIDNLIYQILLNNADGNKYGKSILDNLNFDMKQAIMQTFADFVTSIASNPNLKSPASQK